MTVSTNLEAYYNDICDVVRLFFGDALLRGEEDGLRLLHQAQGWKDSFALTEGDALAAKRTEEHVPFAGTALETDRMRKRACKNVLYRMLKEHTGIRPAWGALTGIRPTRLYAEAYGRLGDEGAAMDELSRIFDVAPEKTALLRDIARAQAEVPAPSPDEADVYVGIPFCPTRCAYCSFAAEALSTGGKYVEPYLRALLREIRMGAEDLHRMGYRPRAVYVGGGTPTTLSPDQLRELLCALREHFPEAKEWTVEAGRPDTIDGERLDALAKGGVGRISVNPQTMLDRTLRTIGRLHDAEQVVRAMELVRQYPFDVVNMDLIAGLPGEGAWDVEETLRAVLAMGPENVTVHTLAIKRASRLRIEGRAELPSEGEASAMVDLAAGMLGGAGYKPYYLYRQKYMAGNLENVGYALPGAACLYNIDNMEETTPILAFGAGAITKWLFPRERRIERAANLKNIGQYIDRVEEMAARKRALWARG